MTTSQRVVWVGVPNGWGTMPDTSSALKVAVGVFPRLTTDEGGSNPTLSLFPDWLDWPSTLGSIVFEVSINGAEAVPATVDPASPVPRSDLWQAVCAPSNLVRPFVYPSFADRRIRSYPVGNVAQVIRQMYVSTLTGSPEAFPAGTDLLAGPIGDIGLLVGKTEAVLTEELEAELTADKAFPDGGVDPKMDFLKARLFQTSYATRILDPSELHDFPKPIDFHQAIGSFNEYPALLRMLGLAVDLLIPAPSSTPGTVSVQVEVLWPGPSTTTSNTSPITRALLQKLIFEPAPRVTEPDVSHGYLDLSNLKRYQLLEVDADGAAFNLRELADNLQRTLVAPGFPGSPTTSTLPALRSGGLSVIHTARAPETVQRLAQNDTDNTTVESGGVPTFSAEDLIRGVRWDAFDAGSGQWYSLCRRKGTLTFTRPSTPISVEVADEGMVQYANSRTADGVNTDLLQGESIVRFVGSSLVVNRPGNAVDPTGAPFTPGTTTIPDYPMRVDLAPEPGSLPPLRYGRTYRVRGRVAFLAGIGVDAPSPDTSTDFTLVTAALRYGRFDPVPAPGLVMTAPRTAGEGIERIVLRSNYDTPASDTAPNLRHVVPRGISEPAAEEHGLFDGPSGMRTDVYAMIAAREGGTFATGGTPDPNSFDQPYYRQAVLSFPVEGGNTAEVPYLPDPFSRGAAFIGLPGTHPGSELQVDFGSGGGLTWPDVRAFRIKLVEGSGPPVLSGRLLTVQVPKGDQVDVRLSSFLHAADLEQMALWWWVEQDARGSVATLRPLALAGRIWLLTPHRILRLVHAVRQPLVQPAFHSPRTARSGIGATAATLTDDVTISRKSTQSIDVAATWQDPVDDVSQPAPTVVDVTDSVGQVDVPDTGSESTFALSIRHELHDTKYHLVRYRMTAKGRFSEYFTEAADVTLTGTTPVVLSRTGIAPDSDWVRSTDLSVTFQRAQDYEVDDRAGTIRRLTGGAISNGQHVLARFLPEPVSRTSETHDVAVLNSSRPSVPQVLYGVPLFGWASTRGASGQSRNRSGNGLRLYLDRSWWSSGAGERLGVVLWGGPTAVPAALDPYVTRWGADPVFASPPVRGTLPVSAFTLATATTGDALLDEVADRVSVAGHDVGFDEGRGLWYADLEVDLGSSYAPFIGLALARFQPNSIDGAHISRAVRAEYLQLSPDRSATLTYGSDPRSVRLTVAGRSYEVSAATDGPAHVEASVDTRDPRIPGDLGWVPVAGGPVTLAPTTSFGITTWTARIPLPSARGGSTRFRLNVREYEAVAGGRRLVYADQFQF